MSAYGIDGETAENHPDIEKQWAVVAFHHAETYGNLIKNFNPQKLRLTKEEDTLYAAFRASFPKLNVQVLNEYTDFKCDEAKAAWRAWIKPFETTVPDFNFATMLRIRANEDYSGDNAFLVTRVQFYAIEIARNREGANQPMWKDYHQEEAASR
ncbi:hypothetical protein CXG81DRAFT_28026 [Caulochytrium protostelioides]|uniref:Polysaccharide biosynthesis domain-containing protein n=1 Tax=Caulochytrium protostelioides TaxID=1555241 RepID=A0A4P9X277_9FUNG|nr:hypothetical protein CXG81DRAFT_28026 [Caulochytrium protostelioides]|eukprot:RKO99203.1 hypothetical protein CXG81DRAFT_28026 [Caulochytrium protostelioides]